MGVGQEVNEIGQRTGSQSGLKEMGRRNSRSKIKGAVNWSVGQRVGWVACSSVSSLHSLDTRLV